jgi:hypothetical protein
MIEKPIVTVLFTAAGDVDSFDVVAFKAKLLVMFADAEDAELTITPASVKIEVKLIMATHSAANVAADRLRNASSDDLSSSLGMSVLSISSPEVSIATVVAAPPPPGWTTQRSVGIVGLVVVGVLLGVLLVLVTFCRKKTVATVRTLTRRTEARSRTRSRVPRAQVHLSVGPAGAPLSVPQPLLHEGTRRDPAVARL